MQCSTAFNTVFCTTDVATHILNQIKMNNFGKNFKKQDGTEKTTMKILFKDSENLSEWMGSRK